MRGFSDLEQALASAGCEKSVELAVRRGEQRLKVEVQPVDSARFFADACAKGAVTGCFYQAWHTLNGFGIATDPELGKRRYEEACGNGSGKACRELATLEKSHEPGVAQRRIQLLERGCELHFASACVDLGVRYYNGDDGLPHDDGRAALLFADACDGGEPAGCADLGFLYQDGRGLPVDYKVAREALEDACTGGISAACGGLACLYEKGLGGVASEERAVAMNEAACRGSAAHGPDFQACLNLGQMLRDGRGAEKDAVRAAKLFEDLCNRTQDEDDCGSQCGKREFAHGCSLLGALYSFGGQGVKRDQRGAIRLSQQGCELGDTFGCYNLGAWYGDGDGVRKDNAKANAYFRRACDGGDFAGCFEVGSDYYHGLGVRKSAKQAAAFFQKACDGEDARGCANLGIFFEHGTGVPRDVATGLALSEHACDLGEPVPCYNLGNRYAEGYLVRQDVERAASFYERACGRGYTPACEKLKRLKR